MRSTKKRCPSSGFGSDGSTALGSMPGGAVGQVGLVWDDALRPVLRVLADAARAGPLSGGLIIAGIDQAAGRVAPGRAAAVGKTAASTKPAATEQGESGASLFLIGKHGRCDLSLTGDWRPATLRPRG